MGVLNIVLERGLGRPPAAHAKPREKTWKLTAKVDAFTAKDGRLRGRLAGEFESVRRVRSGDLDRLAGLA